MWIGLLEQLCSAEKTRLLYIKGTQDCSAARAQCRQQGQKRLSTAHRIDKKVLLLSVECKAELEAEEISGFAVLVVGRRPVPWGL